VQSGKIFFILVVFLLTFKKEIDMPKAKKAAKAKKPAKKKTAKRKTKRKSKK